MKKLCIYATALLIAILLAGCPGAPAVPVLSGNANLNSLVASAGALSPAFDADITGYTLIVPTTVTSLTVTGTAVDVGASVGGQSGKAVSLASGTTIITITVTAQDGTIKQYLVFVIRSDAKYTITFDANGGDAGMAPPPRTNLDDGEVVIVPAKGQLTRPGFLFGYWSTNPEGSGDSLYEPYDFLSVRGADITLYAQWYTEGLAFTLIKGDTECGVSGGTATNAASIAFPRIFNGKKVTAIQTYGFGYFTSITSIVVPGYIEIVGESAFSGCSGLVSCIFSPGVSSIGLGAFSQCSSLVSVSIPGTISTLDSYFTDCPELTDVSIADGVKAIASGVFMRHEKLRGISIPGSVKSIGSWAFRECTGLVSLELKPGVETIDTCAFQGCTGLSSVTIPAGATIGDAAFIQCTALSSVSLSAGVAGLGVQAFMGCSALASVDIPASVTFIGISAFQGCSSLTSINVDPENQYYRSIDGVLYDKDVNCLCCYPSGKTSLCEIPATVGEILENAFYSCPGLAEVRANNAYFVPVPKGPLFTDCPNLAHIRVPASAVDLYKAGWSAYAGIIVSQ